MSEADRIRARIKELERMMKALLRPLDARDEEQQPPPQRRQPRETLQ